MPGAVVHTYNPSYSGRLRMGRSQFKGSLGKKLVRPHLNQQLGMVSHTYHPKLHGRLRSGLQSKASLCRKRARCGAVVLSVELRQEAQNRIVVCKILSPN
jgi:hypothetical protein